MNENLSDMQNIVAAVAAATAWCRVPFAKLRISDCDPTPHRIIRRGVLSKILNFEGKYALVGIYAKGGIPKRINARH